MEKITSQQISLEIQSFLENLQQIQFLNGVNFMLINVALRDINQKNVDLNELSHIAGTISNLENIIQLYQDLLNKNSYREPDYDLIGNCETAILNLRESNLNSSTLNPEE
jgi:hypothetical protein